MPYTLRIYCAKCKFKGNLVVSEPIKGKHGYCPACGEKQNIVNPYLESELICRSRAALITPSKQQKIITPQKSVDQKKTNSKNQSKSNNSAK